MTDHSAPVCECGYTKDAHAYPRAAWTAGYVCTKYRPVAPVQTPPAPVVEPSALFSNEQELDEAVRRIKVFGRDGLMFPRSVEWWVDAMPKEVFDKIVATARAALRSEG